MNKTKIVWSGEYDELGHKIPELKKVLTKDERKRMHFHAGKESALRELLNNVQDKLSEELKINIVARIKEQLRYQSEINPRTRGHSENECKVLDRFLAGEIKI